MLAAAGSWKQFPLGVVAPDCLVRGGAGQSRNDGVMNCSCAESAIAPRRRMDVVQHGMRTTRPHRWGMWETRDRASSTTPSSIVAMTVGCAELGEFEREILSQCVDQLLFRRTEPTALLLQEVHDIPVAEFSDEWGSGKFHQPLTMRNG